MHLILVSLQANNAPSPKSPVGTETIATLGLLESNTSVETIQEMRVFKMNIKGCIKFMLKIMLKMLMLFNFFMPLLLNAL